MTDNTKRTNATSLPWRAFALLIVGQLSLGLACSARLSATRTTAGSGGVPIAYEMAGSGDTALIFVHGWSCDRSYWREQVPAFTGEYRVVALDLGGHGGSPSNRDDWSIESFGQDVAAVAAAVDADHVVLIGHSMGGPVVLDAAIRLGDRVAGIIGVDTLKDASARPVSADRAAEMFTTSADEFPVRMDAVVRRALFTDDAPAELVNEIASDMAAGDPTVGSHAGIAHATFDVGAALRDLDGVPLVLINADYTPTDEDALKAAYPGSRVVVIPDSGHFVMLERPAAFNAALQSELDRLSDVSPPEPVTHVYREVDGQALRAYVFSSATSDSDDEPLSAVLLFHGGGWSAGTPEWTFEAARRFAAHGMVAIPVEYRLSEGDTTPIEAVADVCAAFRWARQQASGLGIDPEQVAGYGVSAGGHLVTSAATVGCPPEGSPAVRSDPDALLLWSPALDLARNGWFEQRMLQGRARAEAYSPVAHVRVSTPPTSIVQGDADTLTPLSGAERYCAQLVELGGTCELNVYEGVGHLLTRNLEYQEGDFDPDPDAVAAGIAEHLQFLRELGFFAAEQEGAPAD